MKHLKTEKRQLMLRKAELEKAIKYDWKDIKESMKPRKMAGQVFSKIFDGEDKGKAERESNGFFAETVSKIAEEWARKWGSKVENKFGDWLRK
jgi:hypothetical protein